MNKILKYIINIEGYFLAFIIPVCILLNVLDKMGVGCLFWCEGDNTPIIQNEDRYFDGKEVKKVQ